MQNKTCMVTGANSGIGKSVAMGLAERGAYVIMVCRNEERARQAREDIINRTGHTGVEILLADLGVQYDVRRAANQFTQKFNALDVLINNAGLVASKREETADGIEKTLAVNHLGPFLLTNLLMEALQKAHHARIINVSSEVHRLGARIFDVNNLQLKTGYSSEKAYGLSKLCNIMFTHQLALRNNPEKLTANVLHPGIVGTQLAEEAKWYMKLIYTVGKPFMRSNKKGAETPLYLAVSDEVKEVSGKYFKDKKIKQPATIALNDDISQQLWDKSKFLTDLM